MTMRCGIDTSILVRLVTGQPTEAFEYCVSRLSALVEDGAEIFASNQVIGEAYVAIQHHYGVSRQDARAGLSNAFRSGLVTPLNGQSVLTALTASEHPGLFDRLIDDDYSRAGLKALTLDRRMARLPNSQYL